jgi:uncharacterized protein (DUF488 family)
MISELLTIGYEGATPDAFDAALQEAGVELLVDVRAVAASRRMGFAKTALSQRLAHLGFSYIHLRDLGDPKPGRDAARAGRWADFRKIFSAHLETAVAIDALALLSKLALRQRTVLLCYEAEAAQCHRAMIADTIAAEYNLVVSHLKASQDKGGYERGRKGRHTRQGCSSPQQAIPGNGLLRRRDAQWRVA